MKKFTFLSFAIVLMVTLSGCGLVEDAFKAGLIFAIIIIAIIAIIVWAVRIVVDKVGKKYTLQTIPVKAKQPIREV